jgi:uncharacterized protein
MTHLDNAELDRLDRYLIDHCAHAGGLPCIEALDGFLCAVVAAPELIPPSEWIEFVWGDAHAFEDQQAATELFDLLMRFYNQIVARIGNPAAASEPTEDLMPLVNMPDIDLDDPTATPDFDTTEYPVGWLWAFGFRLGRELRPDAWERLVDDFDGLDDALLDIDALMLGFDGSGEAPGDDDEQPTLGERIGILSAVPQLLHTLYKNGQAQRSRQALPFRRAKPKVGRNDPCPCGSGRKYKQCHGRP